MFTVQDIKLTVPMCNTQISSVFISASSIEYKNLFIIFDIIRMVLEVGNSYVSRWLDNACASYMISVALLN